jgi:putative peptidoglycan lipid II flippase
VSTTPEPSLPKPAPSAPGGVWSRIAEKLRPSHQHTALSATILLITAQMLSRVIGYLREAYIAWAFGANGNTDVYYAAFQLPDYLYYIVAGGAASITFVAIYTRFLAEKRERDADHVFSVILTVMIAVLGVLIVIAEIFTPQIVHLIFPGFNAAQLRECAYLTRILLPMQLFFYVGGVVSAVLLSHRLFLIPAFAPIFYTASIIAGGVLFSHKLGIAALAYGAVAGAVLGPFLLNALGAARTGIRFRPSFDVGDSAFREWVRMSIPLMLGVSLASADEWIMRWFASSGLGEISRLNYAKRLFAVPYAVLGLSLGVASMTFFARLFSEGRLREFATTINDMVYRGAALSFLASAWLWAAALPLVDLVYRRGRFTFDDTRHTAIYFAWFAASLAFWSAQALYARAFYAARNTVVPMIAATLLTGASIPVFWFMFHRRGEVGLAAASDIGIVLQAAVLAWLLHRRRLVPLGSMKWVELGKAFLVSAIAGTVAVMVRGFVPVSGRRIEDVLQLAAVTAAWAIVVAMGLVVTRSELPGAMRRRRAAIAPSS